MRRRQWAASGSVWLSEAALTPAFFQTSSSNSRPASVILNTEPYLE
jgi:hypothetical protein